MNQKMLLKQIMEYDFTIYELQLYLDTHPENKEALELFRKTAMAVEKLKARYEETFGPITAANNRSDSWQWGSSPWPWEN